MRHYASLLSLMLLAAAGQDGPRMRFARASADQSGFASSVLCGAFAMADGDFAVAAVHLRAALALAPGNADLARQALAADLLGGGANAESLAQNITRTEPGNPVAQLVLASAEAARNHWPQAARHYAAIADDGVFAMMRAPLLAWAQFAAGRKDAASGLLRSGTGGGFLFEAGLMADLNNQSAEAERLYQAADAELGPADFTLARARASLQARQGRQAVALQTLAAAGDQGLDLGLSAARLRDTIARRPLNDAGDGIATVYAAFAALARQQAEPEVGDMLFGLALRLRPGLTVVRLQAAAALVSDGRRAAALALLAPVTADDPLEPSVARQRARLAAAR